MVRRVRRQAAQPESRQGMTLLEILLVLAVLAFISAMAWPSIRGAYGTYKLHAAADQVRSGLNKARNAAMTTGRVHMFRFQTNGDQYVVQPWSGDVADAISDDEAIPAGKDAAVTIDNKGNARPEHLVDGVRFLAGEMAATARSQMVVENDQGTKEAGSDWGSPILFFSDGTSVDAVVRIYNERKNMVPIAIRGLNGTTRVGDLQSAPEATP